jgi:hypothetical protein
MFQEIVTNASIHSVAARIMVAELVNIKTASFQKKEIKFDFH